MARHRIGLSQAWRARSGDPRGIVWVRDFGRPTGLEETDRVYLVIEGGTVAAEPTLNGSPLDSRGELQPRRHWDVTTLLQRRNELLLVPDPAKSPAFDAAEASPRPDRQPLWSPLGEVSLEIAPADDSADDSIVA